MNQPTSQRRFDFTLVSAVVAASAERDYCFERFFPGVSQENVARLDGRSDHFAIRAIADGCIVGGFRLTAIGSGCSEAERLFQNFTFQAPSKELGGFWVSQDENEAARGWIVAAEMFRFLRAQPYGVYFKTSPLKGRAARRFGVEDMKFAAFNHAMAYECHLFRI